MESTCFAIGRLEQGVPPTRLTGPVDGPGRPVEDDPAEGVRRLDEVRPGQGVSTLGALLPRFVQALFQLVEPLVDPVQPLDDLLQQGLV